MKMGGDKRRAALTAKSTVSELSRPRDKQEYKYGK
jgi:hypothetical protein